MHAYGQLHTEIALIIIIKTECSTTSLPYSTPVKGSLHELTAPRLMLS